MASRKKKKPISSEEITISKELMQELDRHAPTMRWQCQGGFRPCPWVRCMWHMMWLRMPEWEDMLKKGDDELIEIISTMDETCVLDMCEQGEKTLEEVAIPLNLTRERIRQVAGCDVWEHGAGTGQRREKKEKGATAKLRRPHIMRRLVMFKDYIQRDGEEEALEAMPHVRRRR